jgi:uncharacterized protein (TIGR02246 family)
VTPLEELLARDEIRTLLARRVRCLDEKDWAGFADVYAPDAVSHSFQGAYGETVVGNEKIAARVAETLAGRTTVHQIHPGEITFLDDTTAEGITPLEDMLFWEQDGRSMWLHGYGHYRHTFEKVDGRWLIKDHALSRLKVERGATP